MEKIQKLFGDKVFIKSMLILFVPAAIQAFISTSVIYVDNFSIAFFAENGTLSKTAVGIASSLVNFPSMIIIGVVTGVGIITSQFFGANSKAGVQETLVMKILFSGLFSIPMILILMLAPNQLAELASGVSSSDPNFTLQNQLTSEYIFWSALVFIPLFLTTSFTYSFIETNRPKIALIASSIAIIVNIVLNPFLIIYSNSDLEAIRNIALATLAARMVELLFQTSYIAFNKNDILRLTSLKLKWKTVKSAIVCGWQVFLNDALYGFSTLFLIICLFKFSPSMHDASTNVSIIIQFTIVIFPGMASACSILVGSELGANNISRAKENSKNLFVWGIMVSLAFSLLLFGLSFFIIDLLSPDISQQSLWVSQQMLWIMIPFVISIGGYSIIYYSLRSGGSQFIFLNSGLVMIIWCVVFGALTFTDTLTGMDPLIYFTLLQTNQLVKLIISIFIYTMTNWAKNVVINEQVIDGELNYNLQYQDENNEQKRVIQNEITI